MHFRSVFFALAAFCLFSSAAAAPFPGCTGSAKYKVKFINQLTPNNFGDLIPDTGLVYSPLAGVSHSGRISFFTIRGFASRPVELIAEKGINRAFLRRAERLRDQNRGVKTVVGADGPTMPGMSTELMLEVDCEHSFVTVLGMIAPSPDWIVQINNLNLYDADAKMFIKSRAADLIAYDTGVDDGRDFTPPLDTSLDMPTVPKQNIAPLVEDETDRFEGRVVGKYVITKV